jgi:hypothetical protein
MNSFLSIVFAAAIGFTAAGRIDHTVAWNQDEPLAGMEGVLAAPTVIAAARARQECIDLPVSPLEGSQAPHGDTIMSTQCQVVAFEPSGLSRWIVARYVWTLVFTAEDSTRGADARDTITQEEAVLFETAPGDSIRPVWHIRFETGPYGVWRSITPEVATTREGTALLSIMSCVNGTGGCTQQFLHRHANGRWFPVTQSWLKALPNGSIGRIRHGVRIVPQTLHGTAGFYDDGDANCCPSHVLEVDLLLRGDVLLLRGPARVRRAKP